MFGGLTKTSSRIAIAAALGLTLGGFAFKATPARAADLGGDCCADLEERVAELEATTVRKGNKKVSVTISGWIVKSMNWWDDHHGEANFVVGDKDYDLGSRFSLTGSAQIAPGWSAGYNATILVPGSVFGFTSDQAKDVQGFGSISTLYSYIYLKSDTWGTLNWGHLSPASDNAAVLADISGTVIESNSVFFEGPGFSLRSGNSKAFSNLTWGTFLQCQGLGLGIGTDCWGAAQPAVRYDSPTWGGFRFETSYGENAASGPAKDADSNNFWDIAAFYTGDWNSIKVAGAFSYSYVQTGIDNGARDNVFQVGGSIMHKPSGLGIYGNGVWENPQGSVTNNFGLSQASLTSIDVNFPIVPLHPGELNFGVNWTGGGPQVSVTQQSPDSSVWYIKPFWRKAWSPIGATVLFGEYGQYKDEFAAGQNLCSGLTGVGGNLGAFCAPTAITPAGSIISVNPVPGDINQAAFVTSSEIQRWGLGVVQEIDSAAMHVWVRWQHQQLDTNITGIKVTNPIGCTTGFETCQTTTSNIHQSWNDWDLFQVGGVIFF